MPPKNASITLTDADGLASAESSVAELLAA